MRRDRSPAMIERLASLIGLDAAQHAAADGDAGDQTPSASSAERQEVDACPCSPANWR